MVEKRERMHACSNEKQRWRKQKGRRRGRQGGEKEMGRRAGREGGARPELMLKERELRGTRRILPPPRAREKNERGTGGRRAKKKIA